MSILGAIAAVGGALLSRKGKKGRAVPGGGLGGVLTNVASIAGSVAAIRGGGGVTTLSGGGALDALPAILGRTGGAVVRGAGQFVSRATTWCRANAAACAAAGGVTAVAALMESGVFRGGGRRRRRRGITPTDLKSFRRVANLIRSYSAPVRRMRACPTRTSTRCP